MNPCRRNLVLMATLCGLVTSLSCKSSEPDSKAAPVKGPRRAPGAVTDMPPIDSSRVAPRKHNPTLKLVKDLAMLAHGIPMDIDDAEKFAQDIDNGHLTLNKLINDLLDSPRVGKQIAKGIIVGGGQNTKTRHPVPKYAALKSKKIDGQRIYFLRRPCAKSAALEVDPWWAPGESVLICPNAYRPQTHRDSKGRTCGSLMLNPSASDLCGCGPRLIYCTRDARHYASVKASVQREVADTIAHVVNKDLPIEQLFLMNETVRNRNVEHLYRRARIAAGESEEVADMDGFSKKSRLARRHEQVPEQHAGILTAPSLIYSSDALRGVLRNFFDYLWCSGQASSGVTTEAVLNLDVVDLREGDGWRNLAAMDICTDCHARLDYGMQFFHGYPSSSQGVDFRPSESLKGQGELYGDGINDLRGKDALTPKGFARLALAQDDFAACMTKKIDDHVFSGGSSTEDFRAIAKTFKETHRFKAMLRTALLRFARKERAAAGSPKTVATPNEAPRKKQPPIDASAAGSEVADKAAGTDKAEVHLPSRLTDKLEEECTHCHDGEDLEDFSASHFPRDLVATMLEQVAFGNMPKTAEGLDDEVRREIVGEFVRVLWQEKEDRSSALAFFGDGMRAHPVHGYRASLRAVAKEAEAKTHTYFRAIEPAVRKPLQRYSPGYAAATALAALRGCKTRHEPGPDLLRCVERATDPESMVVGGVGSSDH